MLELAWQWTGEARDRLPRRPLSCPRRNADSRDHRIYRLPLGDALRLVFLWRTGDAPDAHGRGADRGGVPDRRAQGTATRPDRAGGGLGNISRSEEHTSELQSLMRISYAAFCLKKKKIQIT